MYSPLILGAALLGSVIAWPQLPQDGFPNPNAQQLMAIEQTAQGTPPNGPPPSPGSVSQQGITNFQLINFNENFEVAFFNSLVYNITNNVAGYNFTDPQEKAFVLASLKAVVAQEELHSLAAASILQSQNKSAIQPCQYKFPTTTFYDAIALAATFTDVVNGVLQDVIEIFATNKDYLFTRVVASVIGQEGQQSGFYRVIQQKPKIPSELPFLTTGVRDFAWTFLQTVVVPGSCPNANQINLKVFGSLSLLTSPVQAADQTLSFSINTGTLSNLNSTVANTYKNYDWTKASVAYINQLNVPVVVPITNPTTSGSVVTFSASFPYTKNLLNGLTIAAVTASSGPFADAQGVADATLFAPGIIEIN